MPAVVDPGQSSGRCASYDVGAEMTSWRPAVSRHAVGGLLGRIRDWWRRQEELRALDDKQVGLVAADLGISTEALKDLVSQGPGATRLLYERMRALGISQGDIDHAALDVVRDLQTTCAFCNEKGVCDWDLAHRPEDPGWKNYCPNTVTLECLRDLKARSLARRPA